MVACASPKRQGDFRAGRHCAHVALSHLSYGHIPLLVGAGGAPEWPTGVVGSISHTEGYCGAVVGAASALQGIGFDVERITRAAYEIWDVCYTPAERAWLSRLPGVLWPTLGLLVFSAKESLYKCQYPITRTWLDFTDVQITVPENGVFHAELLRDAGGAFRKGQVFNGRYVLAQGLVGTGVVVYANQE